MVYQTLHPAARLKLSVVELESKSNPMTSVFYDVSWKRHVTSCMSLKKIETLLLYYNYKGTHAHCLLMKQ